MTDKTKEIIERLCNDPEVVKFKLKCRKDGLFFIKSKLTNGGSATEIEIYSNEGTNLIRQAINSTGSERHALCRNLLDKGYTQQEVAAIFQISQAAVSYMANNDYDPHP